MIRLPTATVRFNTSPNEAPAGATRCVQLNGDGGVVAAADVAGVAGVAGERPGQGRGVAVEFGGRIPAVWL